MINSGNVLILKDFLLGRDIVLKKRGYTVFGFDLGGGGDFDRVADEDVRRIKKTYRILLKTLNAKQGAMKFVSNPKKTRYLRKTSHPFGQKKGDVLLAPKDALFLGRNSMTIHDALMEGVWREKGVIPTSPTRKMPPVEHMPYDEAPMEERIRRVISHLDQCDSQLPFSAFVYENKGKQVDGDRFIALRNALHRLAENPKANDRDAREMKKLLKTWFKAAYHYLDIHSTPGDGYTQILRSIQEKDMNKAESLAKEKYWRRHATLFWMPLIVQSGVGLYEDIANNTSLY